MKLIVFVLATIAVVAMMAVGLAVLATLAAVVVRAFRKPIGRWLEWLDDSFSGGRS